MDIQILTQAEIKQKLTQYKIQKKNLLEAIKSFGDKDFFGFTL